MVMWQLIKVTDINTKPTQLTKINGNERKNIDRTGLFCISKGYRCLQVQVVHR